MEHFWKKKDVSHWTLGKNIFLFQNVYKCVSWGSMKVNNCLYISGRHFFSTLKASIKERNSINGIFWPFSLTASLLPCTCTCGGHLGLCRGCSSPRRCCPAGCRWRCCTSLCRSRCFSSCSKRITSSIFNWAQFSYFTYLYCKRGFIWLKQTC